MQSGHEGKIMERSTAFDFAGSIESAAQIVTEGTAFFSSEYLAGQYAFDAAELDGTFTVEDVLAAHLDFLAQAGAEFKKSEALKIAMEFAGEAE
jgi:hypothetical protein